MSYFDDASLAFLPSGAAGKDGKAYSIKPTDGTGDFTFSRGSNLAATRVDADGLIEKGRENLLLQSNAFSASPWIKSSTSVTSGHSGYDGSNDAWKLIQNTNTGYHYISQGITNTSVQTFSFYAKAGEYSGISFFIKNLAGNSAASTFNLSTGTFVNNTHNATAESVGNGWYRISLLTKPNGYQTLSTYVNQTTQQSEAGDGTSGIYIQDAQLEVGLTSTEYIETTTTKGTAGILEDTPRFNYSNGASCPSLLLEPSATQLIGYSEYFGDSYWTKSGSSVVSGFTSPEGLSNAYKLVEDTSVATLHYVYTTSISVSSTTHNFSVFVKSNGSKKVGIRESSGTGRYATFDLINKSVISQTGTDAKIEELSNDWLRLSFNDITTTSTIMGLFLLNDSYASGNPSDNPYTGDGTSGVYIYGANLTQSTFATSYIPNHSGGTITRAADLATGAGTSSTFNDSEGVLFIELETTKNASPSQITINDGTYTNRLIFEVRPDAAFIKALINSGGSNVYEASVSSTPNTSYKVAIKYSANDIAFFVNGVKEASTTTTTAMPTGLIDLSYTGRENDGALRFVGNIKQTLVFSTALSDADCITLTTI